jgi:hypothetical protein
MLPSTRHIFTTIPWSVKRSLRRSGRLSYPEQRCWPSMNDLTGPLCEPFKVIGRNYPDSAILALAILVDHLNEGGQYALFRYTDSVGVRVLFSVITIGASS